MRRTVSSQVSSEASSERDLARSRTGASGQGAGPRRRSRTRGRRRERRWRFLHQWVRHPLRTASMVPSGRALSRLMVCEIGPHTGRVLELGAGTGALTDAILRAGVAAEQLIAVELNRHFADLLREEYPRITVIRDNAEELPRHVEPGSLGAVISSLPMLAFSAQEQRRILAAAFEALRADGHLYQFTYGGRCPIQRRVLSKLGLEARCLGGTLRNWPPARVYRLSRSDMLQRG